MVRKYLVILLIAVIFILLGTTPAWALNIQQITKLIANDGEPNDQFGISVSMADDTAVIGAFFGDGNVPDSGAAYVFVRDSSGEWNQQAKLTASDGAQYDYFGYSVAISEDKIIVGAIQNDNEYGYVAGAAYVFVKNAMGGWIEEAKLTAPTDYLGYSVSVSGNTALVGANLDDEKGSNAGAVFVFTRLDNGQWVQQQKILASDGSATDYFGVSVASLGDSALIGAQFGDGNSYNTGAAYAFIRDSNGIWTEHQKIIAIDGNGTDWFGKSVALENDTAIIGAPFTDSLYSNSGSIYVFSKMSDGLWAQQEKLQASDAGNFDRLGWSVALFEDTIIAGAFLGDGNEPNSGAAYVFGKNTLGNWEEQAKLFSNDGANLDVFGASVAIVNSTVLVGAFYDDDNGLGSGSSYIFNLDYVDTYQPNVSNVAASPNPAAINTALTLNALVDDSNTGGSTITSASYSIDGGGVVTMEAVDGNFDSTTEQVLASIPAFLSAGVHEICVNGTDSSGNTSDDVCVLVAIYDPNDGYVTGGGWIDSPVGSCQLTLACVDITGKANFGLVAKYLPGANVPDGNTEFQFHNGDLNFHSTNYQWLVVNNAKATYKGTGTINGVGNYGFMLKVIDAEQTSSTDDDLFRIKIWDMNNADAIVYDSEIGVADDDSPTLAISGGSIIIQKN
jgi:hypothetical protein